MKSWYYLANIPLTKKYLIAKDFNNVAFVRLSITDSYRQAIDNYFNEKHITRRMVMEVHNASTVYGKGKIRCFNRQPIYRC